MLLDPISECQVTLNPSQMCPKSGTQCLTAHSTLLSANQIGPRYSLWTCPSKTKLKIGNHHSFINRTLILCEDPFSEKYSNGPGHIQKNYNRSKFDKKIQKGIILNCQLEAAMKIT